MGSRTINALLEKQTDPDKDARFMATSDLAAELQKDVKIDAAMDRRICQTVLKQLDDQSNDVQSIAVKCLSILFKKVQPTQVSEISDKLCNLILHGKAELRDIYSIGLKTLISDVPEHVGKSVAQQLCSRLLGGVDQETALEVKLECLDNLTDLLKRFGRDVEGDHEQIMRVSLRQLRHPKPVVRKRANAVLGAVAVVISDPLLDQLMDDLLSQIEGETNAREVQTFIQTSGTISRTVGHRLGKHLSKIVPLFLRCIGEAEDETEQDDQRNDLRETCFGAFESVVVRCPREVSDYLPKIVNVSLDFMKYDPNYTYEDGDEAMQQEEEEDAEEDDYAGSDDDDTSWKVRRSALKVLSAVITSRPELLQELYDMCADELIGRFKEREENVRLDVISCFASLLKSTLRLDSIKARHSQLERWAIPRSSGANTAMHVSENGEVDSVALALLSSRVEAIVRASDKQLKEPKDQLSKTKSAVLGMLRSLCDVMGGRLDSQLPILLADIKRCLKDKSQTLKLDALCLLQTLLEAHSADSLYHHIADLVPMVAACAGDDWYKLIAQALRVIGVITGIIRPFNPQHTAFEGDYDSAAYVTALYVAIYERLNAHDIDQEIKECAITAMGRLVTHLGDHIHSQLPGILSLLMEKLRNEITRTSTLKALALIASSPLQIDLSPILDDAVSELALFLRQQSRPLKLATLETLIAFVKANSEHMTPELFALIISEASNLVSDVDLHLSHLALLLTVEVLKVSPPSAKTVAQQSLPHVLKLASSPLLQGYVLRSLQQLLDVLVTSNAPGLDFKSLIQALEDIALMPQSTPVPKQVVANLAICMACVSTHAKSTADRNEFIQRLVTNLRSPSDLTRHLALLCIGELGAQRDLSKSVRDLQPILLDAFDSGNEETKTSAAYALGHVAAGNPKSHLPPLLQMLSNPEKPQYLLLLSLKELIVTLINQKRDFSSYVREVLPHLFEHAKHSEEGIRNMVAECLGTLAGIDPATVFGALKAHGDSDESQFTHWTLATALKYAVSSADRGEEAGTYLAEHKFLMQAILEHALAVRIDGNAPSTEDLDVVRATLLMINAAAHHQPRVLLPFLQSHAVALVFKFIDLKLLRKVNLGPFTHQVDDGLSLRKASFACIDTIMSSLPNVLEMSSFMPFLAKGLDDKDDVQLLSHQILVKVCRTAPRAVLASLDLLLPPLEAVSSKTVKDMQVTTEVERTSHLIRSALRCLIVLDRVEGVPQSSKYTQLVDRVSKKESVRPLWNMLQSERSRGHELE